MKIRTLLALLISAVSVVGAYATTDSAAADAVYSEKDASVSVEVETPENLGYEFWKGKDGNQHCYPVNAPDGAPKIDHGYCFGNWGQGHGGFGWYRGKDGNSHCYPNDAPDGAPAIPNYYCE